MADVSHLNDESFWDVIKAARRPVIATHSNSRLLCNVPRNLTDDQFGCIAERGGLVGLNFYTGFLREDREHACMEDILRHAEHFLNLGGEDVLALGSDFDGADMPYDLPDCGALPQLAQRLREAFGFTLTEKICYKNALDFGGDMMQNNTVQSTWLCTAAVVDRISPCGRYRRRRHQRGRMPR